MARLVIPLLASVLAVAGMPGNAKAVDVPLPAFPAPPQGADPFYTPPSPLPKGKPGDVLKVRDVALGVHPGATTRQVMYLSRDNQGKLTPVTAALFTPLGIDPSADNPLVAHSPGTRGLADHCAPSRQADLTQANPASLDYSHGEYEQFLAHGVSVIVTDYQGLGTPGDHSYLVAKPEGQAVLDALRAAQHVPGSGITAESPLGISGYSQGGQGAAAAAELVASYAPELNVRGVLGGGVPRNMLDLINHLDGNPTAGAGFALSALVGLAKAFPALDLEARLTPKGRELIGKAKSSCYGEDLLAFGTASISDATSPDVLSLPDWRAAFAESELGKVAPRFPAYLVHAYSDTVVPFQHGRRLFHDWCARGASVTFEAVPYEHVSGVLIAPPRGIEWLVGQLEHPSTPTGCTESGLL